MIFEKIREKLFYAVQEAKVLQETTDSYGYMMVKKGLNHATDIVNEVEAEYNNGWIPCSERLPEDKQPIIATFLDGRVYQVNFILFLYENPQYAHDNKVIAWQPLPEPYKK